LKLIWHYLSMISSLDTFVGRVRGVVYQVNRKVD